MANTTAFSNNILYMIYTVLCLKIFNVLETTGMFLMSKEVKDFVIKRNFNPEIELLEDKIKIRIQTFFSLKD